MGMTQTTAFTVGNFKSITDDITIRLQSYDAAADPQRVAAIFGRNGAGKTTVLDALGLLQALVCGRLTTDGLADPDFEIAFIGDDGAEYSYALGLSGGTVAYESLAVFTGGTSVVLFTRDEQEVTASFVARPEVPPSNVPFLTVCAAQEVAPAARFFATGLVTAPRPDLDGARDILAQVVGDVATRECFERVLHGVLDDYRNLHIRDGVVVGIDCRRVDTSYTVWLDQASASILTLIVHAATISLALTNGATAIIDDFGTGLHPLVTSTLLAVIQSPRFGQGQAQLICATHEATLLLDTIPGRMDKLGTLAPDETWLMDAERDVTAVQLAEYDMTGDIFVLGCYLFDRFGGVPHPRGYML